MGLSKINPTNLNSWSGLEEKFKAEGDNHISSFFEERDRLEEFTISWKDFYVDFSKNRLSSSTLKLLIDLSNETNLKNNIEKYFYLNTDAFLNDISNLNFRNEIILVKGARAFKFERIVARLEQQAHRTLLEQ